MELSRLAVANDISCWAGPELDVLQRFKETARAAKADVIVRLTADCPLLDPEIIDQCIRLEGDSTEEWPDGLDVQVFRPHMLELGDTEHVVGRNWIRPQLVCPEGNLRHVRVTLDTAEDLSRLRNIADRLPSRNRAPTWRETLDAVRIIEGTSTSRQAVNPAGYADIQ